MLREARRWIGQRVDHILRRVEQSRWAAPGRQLHRTVVRLRENNAHRMNRNEAIAVALKLRSIKARRESPHLGRKQRKLDTHYTKLVFNSLGYETWLDSRRALAARKPAALRSQLATEMVASMEWLAKPGAGTTRRQLAQTYDVFNAAAQDMARNRQVDAGLVAYRWAPRLLQVAGVARDHDAAENLVREASARTSVADVAGLVRDSLARLDIHNIPRMSSSEIIAAYRDVHQLPSSGAVPDDKSWEGQVAAFATERANMLRLPGETTSHKKALPYVLAMAHATYKAEQIDRALESGSAERIDLRKRVSYGPFATLPRDVMKESYRQALERGVSKREALRQAYALTVIEVLKDVKVMSEAVDAAVAQ